MAVSELHYEPSVRARPVIVERDGGTTRVIVLMHGLYVPVPSWIASLDLFAVIVAPVWWVATLILRIFFRLPKPPRAVFEITDDRFKMTLRDPGSGAVSVSDWPRSAV